MAENKQANPLELSDEELMELDPETLDEGKKEEEQEDISEESKEEEIENSEDSPEDETDEDDSPSSEEDEEESEDEVEDEQKQDVFDADSDNQTDVEKEEDDKEQDETNYKAVVDSIFAPFKASGQEMQAKTVEDVRQLMEMGADYRKKMMAMKPSMKVLRALESNGLLDESKVNLMIAVHKKDPKAIRQLLKDSEIDPMDLDQEETDEAYQPQNHLPSDGEMELTEVLDSIADSPSYEKTLDELGNKWDQPSRDYLSKHPNLIALLNGHVEAGIYDKIMNQVQNERMFGRLRGISDLEAYKQVGDALQQQGALTQKAPNVADSEPTRKAQEKSSAARRKKAAQSPTRGTGSVQKDANKFNPLAMSDDEFEKISAGSF